MSPKPTRGWGAVHRGDADPLIVKLRTVRLRCRVCGKPGRFMVTPEAAPVSTFSCGGCYDPDHPRSG